MMLALRTTDGRIPVVSRREAFDRYARTVDGPLTVVAGAMIPLLVVPLLVELSQGAERAFVAADYLIWAVFAVDYVTRVVLAPDRWRFIRTHPFDLLIVLVPFLRPLRVVRSARALRLLRLARLTGFLGRGIQSIRAILGKRGLNYVLLVVVALVFVAGALMREFEHGVEGSNIASFPDALWWAATTITTVGYGDRFPVTSAGRGVAVVLMIVGIALLGIVTASIAAFFVEQEQKPEQADLVAELRAIRERLEALERR
jgi:voltage-gated potassium channel